MMEIDEQLLAAKFEAPLLHLDERTPSAGAGRGGALAGARGIEGDVFVITRLARAIRPLKHLLALADSRV